MQFNNVDIQVYTNMLRVLTDEVLGVPFKDGDLVGYASYNYILTECYKHRYNVYSFTFDLLQNVKYIQKGKRLTFNRLSRPNIDRYLRNYHSYVEVAHDRPKITFYQNFFLRAMYMYYSIGNDIAKKDTQLQEFLIEPLPYSIANLRSNLLEQQIPLSVVYVLIKGIERVNSRYVLIDNDIYSMLEGYDTLPSIIRGGIQNYNNLPAISDETLSAYKKVHLALINN